MNHSHHQRLIYMFFMALAFSVACSDNDPDSPSIARMQMEKLKGTWVASGVTVDNAAQSGYETFTFTIHESTAGNMHYVITNNPERSPWISAHGGTLFFRDRDPEKYLHREDDVEIEYTVSETTLVMRFSYAEDTSGGRASNITGTWEFTLSKD